MHWPLGRRNERQQGTGSGGEGLSKADVERGRRRLVRYIFGPQKMSARVLVMHAFCRGVHSAFEHITNCTVLLLCLTYASHLFECNFCCTVPHLCAKLCCTQQFVSAADQLLDAAEAELVSSSETAVLEVQASLAQLAQRLLSWIGPSLQVEYAALKYVLILLRTQ